MSSFSPDARSKEPTGELGTGSESGDPIGVSSLPGADASDWGVDATAMLLLELAAATGLRSVGEGEKRDGETPALLAAAGEEEAVATLGETRGGETPALLAAAGEEEEEEVPVATLGSPCAGGVVRFRGFGPHLFFAGGSTSGSSGGGVGSTSSDRAGGSPSTSLSSSSSSCKVTTSLRNLLRTAKRPSLSWCISLTCNSNQAERRRRRKTQLVRNHGRNACVLSHSSSNDEFHCTSRRYSTSANAGGVLYFESSRAERGSHPKSLTRLPPSHDSCEAQQQSEPQEKSLPADHRLNQAAGEPNNVVERQQRWPDDKTSRYQASALLLFQNKVSPRQRGSVASTS